MFDMKKDLKDSNNFNKWFNDQFEKHRLEDPVEHGYGNWLKSDEDIIFTLEYGIQYFVKEELYENCHHLKEILEKIKEF